MINKDVIPISKKVHVFLRHPVVKAQTILRISTVLSESILLMKYETRWRSRLRISHPAQVDNCGCAFEIYSG